MMTGQEVHRYKMYPRKSVLISKARRTRYHAWLNEECRVCGCSEVHPIHNFGLGTTNLKFEEKRRDLIYGEIKRGY